MTMLEVLTTAFRNSGVEFLTQEVYSAADIPILKDGELWYEHQNNELKEYTVLDVSFIDPRLPFLKQYMPIYRQLNNLGHHLVLIGEHKTVLPSGRTQTKYFFRLFKRSDYVCKGHPELLLGKPIGQYRCEYCNEMQCAGTPHLPKEILS